MSSRQQLDVRNLSLGMRHLVNAYEVEEVRCNLQVTLCDPYLGALSARYYNKSAIINPLPLPLPFPLPSIGHITMSSIAGTKMIPFASS